jgi:hypothetical protein
MGTSPKRPKIFVSPYCSTVTCVENEVFRSSLLYTHHFLSLENSFFAKRKDVKDKRDFEGD